MNPLVRKVRSQAEKDELLRLAKQEWDRIPGEVQHLVAASDEHFLPKVSDSIEVESPAFIPPREATAAEKNELDGKLVFSRLYGDRGDDKYSSIPAFAEMEKAQEQRDLEKLLGPGRRAESTLEIAVREMVRKATGNNSVPRRESEREGIVPRLAAAAVAEDASSLLSRFLQGYVTGDEQAMRRVAREFAAEAA